MGYGCLSSMLATLCYSTAAIGFTPLLIHSAAR